MGVKGGNQFVAMGYRWRWSINRLAGSWAVNIGSRKVDFDSSVVGSYSDAKAYVDENIKAMQLCDNLDEYEAFLQVVMSDRLTVVHE